jgi:hypothetical protein
LACHQHRTTGGRRSHAQKLAAGNIVTHTHVLSPSNG